MSFCSYVPGIKKKTGVATLRKYTGSGHSTLEVMGWRKVTQNRGSFVRIFSKEGFIQYKILIWTHIWWIYRKKNEELDKTSRKVVIRWEIGRKVFRMGYLGESKTNKGGPLLKSKFKKGSMWPRIPVANFKWAPPTRYWLGINQESAT